jgi:radical SAM protein with 4Fe4S-binding SPASM domain
MPAFVQTIEHTRDRLRTYRFHTREFIRCTTVKKLANFVRIKAQYLLRRDRIAGMPINYFVDPINICNLHCPLCPTGRGVLARPRGRMALDDLRQIIDQIAPYAYRVELYNWGEPLLHPDIFDMIEYAVHKRITVGLSSNLNRLDRNSARRLVESGLSQLVVSIDGATQESYETYRRGGSLERVLENLKLLTETRALYKRSTPFIIGRMLIGKHNERQVEAVRDIVYQAGADSFATGMLYINTHDAQQREDWISTDPACSPYDQAQPELENTWHCRDLWENMVINWDGGVAPCCWLHDPQFDFGNALEQTIREIWNGPYYVSARRALGKHPQQPGDVPTICHRCRGHPDYMAY